MKSPRKTKKADLELLLPSNDDPLAYSKYSTLKIKREIDSLNKTITSHGLPRKNYKNRPILNLNKPEVQFNSREFLAQSPTKVNSVFIHHDSIFKNSRKRKASYASARDGYSSTVSKINLARDNKHEFDDFLRNLNPNQKGSSYLEKYSMTVRKRKATFN